MNIFHCAISAKNSILTIALLLGLLLHPYDGFGEALDAPRPIPSRPSVFLEELTWMETRDAIASGKRTAIIPTGGVEQSGPYLPLGKHNFILSRTMELLATELGDALVAPVVKYVPEGSIEPRTGHMMYPGTISVREEVFVLLLKEIARSLRTNGFRTIVLLGDSGDNLRGLALACDQLNAEWANSDTKAIFVQEYYNYKEIESWLTERGYAQVPEGIHDDLAFTAELLAIDEDLVRYKERASSGHLSINGVSLADRSKIQKLGVSIMEMRAHLTARRIRQLRETKSS